MIRVPFNGMDAVLPSNGMDAAKFGTKEYTPYEVFTKALYEYFKEWLGESSPGLGRSAVDLAEFQEDDGTLVEEVLTLSEQFGKQRADETPLKRLTREDLELICFEYVPS
jgi:hypothetical protein